MKYKAAVGANGEFLEFDLSMISLMTNDTLILIALYSLESGLIYLT